MKPRHKYLPLLASKHTFTPDTPHRYTVHIFRNKKAWEDVDIETLEQALDFFKNARRSFDNHENEIKKFLAAKKNEQ